MKWEKFEHDACRIGVRMPSENRTKYGAVRYVVVGGYDTGMPEQLAEARAIADMIAAAPEMLEGDR